MSNDTHDPQGDPARNVAVLFNKYRRYVAKIGGSILGVGNEVDDLVQDVFLAMHRDLHKLDDLASVKAWLGTIAVRVGRRRLRQRSRHVRIGQIEPAELNAMGTIALGPELEADLAGGAQRFLELPRRLQTAWLLKHIECETLPTIAERCQCSASTVQRRIRDATLRMLGPGQGRR